MAETNLPDAADNHDDNGGAGAVHLLTVPRDRPVTVDSMKQDVSTATITSYEDYNVS